MASTFGKSFAREMGKNTGKLVSNALFGDHWSTPYRRVGSRSDEQARAIRAQASAARAEAAQIRADAAQRRAEAAETKAEIARNESLYRLDTAVIANIDKLVAVPIPRQIEPLNELLCTLSIQMRTVKYETDYNEGDIRNKYLYALIEKYRQCLWGMKSVSPNDPRIQQYDELLAQRELEIFKNEAIGDYYWSDGDINKLRMAQIPNSKKVLRAYMDVLTEKLKAMKYDSFLSHLSNKNEYMEVLFAVYKDFLHAFQEAYPKDPNIKKYAKLLANKEFGFYQKAFWKKKKGWYKYLFLISIIVATIGSILKQEHSLGAYMLPVGAVMLLVLIVLWALKIKDLLSMRSGIINEFCAPKEKPETETYYQPISPSPEVQPSERQEVVSSVSQIVEVLEKTASDSKSLDDDEIFFDLNENNRIGNELNRIWGKYGTVVNPTIMNRRPIFAADGVKDSILFVGVNPSYDPEDDNKFLENDDRKTLLYGSFYGREDSPMYFKRLEMFAAELGKSYSQINLLYARENDRNKLLKTNPDFIREQLELTYDTIVKINPKAIIFFTSYCKDLIYGPGRWADQSSLNTRSGSYILNGTNIPIFFSEDVTTLDADSVDDLISRMKIVL